ncbi:hypothetical protein D3C80_1850520 [compost metagenome]
MEATLLPPGDRILLRFSLEGRPQEWELARSGTALDPELLLRLAGLLQKQGDQRQYAYAALGGPDALIVCLTAEELDALNRLTGLGFSLLAGSGFRF